MIETLETEMGENILENSSTGSPLTTMSNGNDVFEENDDETRLTRKKQTVVGSDESSEDDTLVTRTTKRIQRFSDSDESASESTGKYETGNQSPNKSHSDRDSKDAQSHNASQKSRLRLMSSSSDTDAETNRTSENEQESRIKSKKSKLTQKFKSLVSSRKKDSKRVDETEQSLDIKERESKGSHSSDDEASSIERIKKIIKEKMVPLKSTIYDPDTSDEEDGMTKKMQPLKKGRKSTKPTSPKPMRMSAKQAMENMQKIKSESNRMLREKDVSLPYHRPKALSLKDIMSRRRPALAADGKALPIKMNEEQLKHYVQLLDQRQKEIMELCKSDTDEESLEEEIKKDIDDPEEKNNDNDTLYDSLTQGHEILKSIDLDKEKHQDKASEEAGNKDSNKNKLSDSNELDADKTNTDVQNHEVLITCNISETLKDSEEKITIESDLPNDSTTTKDNNELDGNDTGEMELVYNNSVEEASAGNIDGSIVNVDKDNNINEIYDKSAAIGTERDSQLISLHYDSERTENMDVDQANVVTSETVKTMDIVMQQNKSPVPRNSGEDNQIDDFSDDEVNMDEIDALIENAVVATSQSIANDNNSPMLIKDPKPLRSNPKLMGAPGMIIDLDGNDPFAPKKLSGVELLKERFVYFSKLKTPEELERDKENRIKPGVQHFKLKQDLEDQIAEQRSLEWSKRLEEEKQQQKELNAVIGDDEEDAEDDIEKIEAKLQEEEGDVNNESSSESEEEIEEDIDVPEKPRKRNPMVDDEAEESDCDDVEEGYQAEANEGDPEEEGNKIDDGEDSEEASSDESENLEVNQKLKQGRILKAFEDSDDEDSSSKPENNAKKEINADSKVDNKLADQVKGTQDDDLQLAQMHQSISEDLFTSQESELSKKTDKPNSSDQCIEDTNFDTQTFSILECNSNKKYINMHFTIPDKICNTQPFDDNMDEIAGMCSGSFSQTQNLVPPSQSQLEVPESQVINDDVLALCTGQFYDNEFVSQISEGGRVDIMHSEDSQIPCKETEDRTSRNINKNSDANQHVDKDGDIKEGTEPSTSEEITQDNKGTESKKHKEDDNLKSILDELNNPEFDKPKSNKYFPGNQDKENESSVANTQLKKKFIIDSDDDDEKKEDSSVINKKKIKKKKLEQRALQISDDEESDQEVDEEYESAVEEDEERMVEYDSDENEVVVQPQKPKKKRKLGEFFEQEAELTSEDEWIGSGDEDEAGLDRMEREEGDDDTFNQNQLQRELGQIHMRDVLDQDKREVRLIQELLFEDGDLGDGQRQRKFRWRDADGGDLTGTTVEVTDTQEEEFESEEQWRKERHEREMFLKALKNKEDPEESLNVSVNRSSIIKANLSNTTSSLFLDMNTSGEMTAAPAPEKKTAKDIPSPKKPFTIFQQNYHGSLLTRGRGALARLAALATPLANDDDSPKIGSLAPSSKRNFVFAALDPTPDVEPKVTKRKAEGNIGTPKLVKKMRTEEKTKYPKSSLLDHIKT